MLRRIEQKEGFGMAKSRDNSTSTSHSSEASTVPHHHIPLAQTGWQKRLAKLVTFKRLFSVAT